MINQTGRTVNTLGLPLAARVRKWGFQAINHESVVGAGPCLLHGCRPIASRLFDHRKLLVSYFDFHGAGARSPDLKYMHSTLPCEQRSSSGLLLGWRGIKAGQSNGGVHHRDVREGLGKIPYQALSSRVVFLSQQADVIG